MDLERNQIGNAGMKDFAKPLFKLKLLESLKFNL